MGDELLAKAVKAAAEKLSFRRVTASHHRIPTRVNEDKEGLELVEFGELDGGVEELAVGAHISHLSMP